MDKEIWYRLPKAACEVQNPGNEAFENLIIKMKLSDVFGPYYFVGTESETLAWMWGGRLVLSVISLTGVLFVACGVYHSIFTVLEQMLLIVIVSSADCRQQGGLLIIITNNIWRPTMTAKTQEQYGA